jgi:hypothetical protein
MIDECYDCCERDKLTAHIVELLDERDKKIEELKSVIGAMMYYLPSGGWGTCDVSSCKKCGCYVGSGSITYCESCMWEVAKEAIRIN